MNTNRSNALPRAARLALVATVLLSRPVRAAPGEADAGRDVMENLVNIEVSASVPDAASPWQRKVTDVAGSGVILGERRILTNAHVIADRVDVEVKRAGHSRRYPARVTHVGHDCDLALLTVEDESFFKGVRPFPLGGIPAVRDQVDVYGFPVGGESASVTSGIVSRIEVQPLVHSDVEVLQIQIDAAVNPGNSGGPVVAGGLLVGVAAQELEDAQNVAYVIPAPVIRHFLDDVADGRYDGLPDLGIDGQSLESEAQRRFLGLAEGENGALVNSVDYGGSASGVLEPGDVLLKIDGKPIAEDLTVPMEGIGPVSFLHVVRSRQVGDALSVTYLRHGERHDASVKLRPYRMLVPGPQYDREPTYLIVGGLVFLPLGADYLKSFEDEPPNLAVINRFQNEITAERSQVVVLSRVLAHASNRGFHDWENLVVRKVNGVVPRDMKHFAEIVDSARGPWLELVFDDRSHLVLDVAQARAAGPRILSQYGIAADRSPDLRQK